MSDYQHAVRLLCEAQDHGAMDQRDDSGCFFRSWKRFCSLVHGTGARVTYGAL
jgi:hypothetical protein